MTYREETRDLFTVPEGCCLAQCISADLAMGKGIAVAFNRHFDMKRRLRQRCPNYREEYAARGTGGDCILEGRVLNLVTKERYFQKPTLSSMEAALREMRAVCRREEIRRVAMPRIGAGLDRLPWEDVSALIKAVFAGMDIEILVCSLEP